MKQTPHKSSGRHRLLLLLILTVLLVGSTVGISAFANQTDTPTPYAEDPNNTFTAVLYPDELGASGNGVALTQNSTDSLSISEGRNRLEIDWTYTQDKVHTLDITVPVGMKIVAWTPGDGTNFEADDVVFTPLAEQGTGTHVNAQAGTLQYKSINTGGTASKTEKIVVYLEFDQVIWSKSDNHEESLTGAIPPVTVTMDVEEDAPLTKTLGKVTTAAVASLYISNNGLSLSGDQNLLPGGSYQSTYAFRISAKAGSIVRDDPTLYKSVTYSFDFYVTRNGSRLSDITVPVNELTFADMSNCGSVETEYKLDGKPNQAKITINDYKTPIAGNNGLVKFEFTLPQSTAYQAGDQLYVKCTVNVVPYIGEPFLIRNVNYDYYTATQRITVEGPDYAIQRFDGVTFDEAKGAFNNAPGAADFLGQLSLYNAGTGAGYNETVKVVFDSHSGITNGEPAVKVYSYGLPLLDGQSTTVTYTLINDSGTTVGPYTYPTGEAKNNKGVFLAAKTLADHAKLDGTWYLKSVEYVIPEIPAGKHLQTANPLYGADSMGVIMGRANGTADKRCSIYVNGTLIHYCRVYMAAYGATYTPINYVYPSQGSNMSLYGGTENTFSFRIMGTQTPLLTSSSVVQSPTVFFVAPAGVSVTSAYFGDNNTAASVEDTGTAADGSHIYKIALGDTVAIGYYYLNEDATGYSQVPGPKVTLKLKVEPTVGNATYSLNERLLVTSKYTDGTYLKGNSYLQQDKFDVDQDGNVRTTMLSSFATSYELSTISYNSAASVTASVSSDGKTFISGSRVDQELIVATGDTFIYRVQVSNPNDVPVQKGTTAIYIPIPKKNVTMPGEMGGVTPSYSLRLVGAVTGDVSNWDIRYSTDATADTYNNNSVSFEGEATWKTADQMTADDWKDVTMIKAVIKETALSAGTVNNLDVPIRFEPTEPNSYIIWASAHWSLFDKNGETNHGEGTVHNSTYTRVKTATNIEDGTDIKDTEFASYNTTVTAGSENAADLSAVIELLDKGQVELKVVDIRTHNVTLVPFSEIANSTGLSVAEQDQRFALQIALGGTTLDLGSSDTVGKVLGMTNDHSKTPVTVTLGHYPRLADVTTQRYVDVQLRDDMNALDITLRINIARVMSKASASTGIVAGKYYDFLETGDSANITSDSAYTASFAVTGFIPSNNDTPSFEWSENLPKGTRLLLVDLSAAAPHYYGYDLTDAVKSVSLEQFKNLISGSAWSVGSGSEVANKNLLLVVDFANTAGLKSHTLNLQTKLTDGTTASHGNLQVNVGSGRTFNFSGDKDSKTLDTQMSVHYTVSTNVGTGEDQKWGSRGMALHLSIKNGVFPAGAYAVYNGRSYTPAPDGSYIIIPLGVLGSYSPEITVFTPYQRLSGSQTLVAECWVSATASDENPLGGYKLSPQVETPFTAVNTAQQMALHLTMAGNDRIYTKAEAENGIAVTVTSENLSGAVLHLQLEKKSGGTYTDTGNSFAVNDNAATVSIPNAQPGTYRLVLTAGDTGIRRVLSFIVTD